MPKKLTVKYPRAQYFALHGACRTCGGKSAGLLFDYTNRQIGPFCKRHGDQHVRASHQKYNKFHPDAVTDDGWKG